MPTAGKKKKRERDRMRAGCSFPEVQLPSRMEKKYASGCPQLDKEKEKKDKVVAGRSGLTA